MTHACRSWLGKNPKSLKNPMQCDDVHSDDTGSSGSGGLLSEASTTQSGGMHSQADEPSDPKCPGYLSARPDMK